MSKQDNIWKYIAITVTLMAGILATYFYMKDKENKKKISDLEKEVEESESFNKQIKLKLIDLIENNKDLDPKISIELGEIASLIESKHELKAITSLAKIIENLLKELYKGDQGVKELANKKGRKKATFDDYLEYAKVKGAISTEDYHLIAVMKIIRNEESHELAVKKEKSKIINAFLVGFTTITVLWKLLKTKTSDKLIEKVIELK